MNLSKKYATVLAFIAFVAIVLLIILDADELKELFQVIIGLIVLCIICLYGYANSKDRPDRSRKTIDWEMDQECKAKEDEEPIRKHQ